MGEDAQDVGPLELRPRQPEKEVGRLVHGVPPHDGEPDRLRGNRVVVPPLGKGREERAQVAPRIAIRDEDLHGVEREPWLVPEEPPDATRDRIALTP